MLYHYFGSKSQLYVAVLEEALAGLRRRELEIDVEHLDPREGLLQLFDFLSTISNTIAISSGCFGGKHAEGEIHAEIFTHFGNVIAGTDMIERRSSVARKPGNCREGLTDFGFTF